VGAGSVADGRNLLAELKADPGKVGLETLLREIDKLAAVQALSLPAELSPTLRRSWSMRGGRGLPAHSRRICGPRRRRPG
jgi:hypothetical protein